MGVGGGGAYLKNRDQIVNVRAIRYASSANTQRRVSNLQTIKFKLFGTTFNDTGKLASAEGARRYGGLGACLLQKNFKSESLKRIFLRTLRPIAVSKRFLKLIIFFLTLTKRALSSSV